MADYPVELTGIRKSFGSVPVVDGFDLQVRPAEFVTLLGPSGCGKTTTLNIVAGFLQPDAGSVFLNGREVRHAPPFQRDIGFVFQDYALFPHMTVAENISFGLRMRSRPRDEIARRVAEAIDLVRLNGLDARMPLALSGGQRQRVALARALVINPTVLLLDEPLSNLDLKLREEMRLEISRLQRRLGIATVLVTHDQSEALAVSDRIAVMNAGRIEQIGLPSEIYSRPTSRFVAEFIGSMNFIAGVAKSSTARGEMCHVELDGNTLPVPAAQNIKAENRIVIATRPERCRVTMDRTIPPDCLAVAGRVVQQVYLGAMIEIHVMTQGGPCVVAVPNDGRLATLAPDMAVNVTADLRDCVAFPSS